MRKLFTLYIIQVAFSALCFRCYAQNIPCERRPLPGEGKDLLAEIKNSEKGVQRIEATLKLSAYYLYLPGEEKEDLDKAMWYARDAREQSESLGFADGSNEAMILMGNVFIEEGKNSSSQAFLDSAIVSISKINNDMPGLQPGRRVRVLKQLATIHRLQNKFTLAETEYLELIRLYQKFSFPNLHYTYEWLSIIQMINGDWNKSLYYALEMMRSMEATGDSSSAGSFYYDLGFIYRQIGQFQKAVDYYNKSYLFYKKKPSSILYELGEAISEAFTKMKNADAGISFLKSLVSENPPQSDFEKRTVANSLGTCYRVLKRYDLAEGHFLQVNTFQSAAKPIDIGWQRTMGQLYIEWGKYEKARPYLENCLKFGNFSIRPLAHLHFLFYKMDSAAGNYLSAIDHLMINKELDDSVYRESKVRENRELQIKYETEKKDQDIKIKQQDIELLKKRDLIKQATLSRVNLVKNMTILGIGLLSIILILLFNRYLIKQRNNQQISDKNALLQHLLDEKEWLLKEVHHRVKNNLHTVMSLLETQSAYLKDDALAAIQNSQHRVFAMSLIHQKLYQLENSTSINMSVYLPELIDYLRDSFDVNDRIRFRPEIQHIQLDISKAIPIGLIVNEAVTNSIKYAFPGNSQGEIHLEMKKVDGQISLSVTDNGIGIPHNWKEMQQNSLGLKLMKGLTDDIYGKFKIEVKSGTKITVTFKGDLVTTESGKKENLKLAEAVL